MDPVPAGAGGLPPVVHEMLAAPLLQREVRASTEGCEAAHASCQLFPMLCSLNICVCTLHEYLHLHAAR